MCAAALYSQALSPRTINVKVVADENFRTRDSWMEDTCKIIRDSFFQFDKRFGIHLKIKDCVYWKPEGSKKPIPYFLNDLRNKVNKETSDLVLGIISPQRIAQGPAAGASFPDGYILVIELKPKYPYAYLLSHELCHIFGAVDLNEKDTIMAVRDPSHKFDAFTQQAILLHKDRPFSPGSLPLPRDKVDEAISLFRQRAELRLGESEIFMRLINLYGEKKDYASALSACSDLQKLNPNQTELHSLLGNIYLNQNDNDKAIDEFQKALGISQELPDTYCNLGLAYARKGLSDDAEAQYKLAVKLGPNHFRSHANLATLYLKRGKIDQAISECQTALAICPEMADVLCTQAAALVQRNDRVVTFSGCPEVPVWDPNIDNSALARRAENEIREAEGLCRKALILKPDLPEAHNVLGIVYINQKKYGEAEAEFLRALEISPDHQQAHYYLGLLYFTLGSTDKAAFHLRKIIEIDPSSDLGLWILARSFRPREPIK